MVIFEELSSTRTIAVGTMPEAIPTVALFVVSEPETAPFGASGKCNNVLCFEWHVLQVCFDLHSSVLRPKLRQLKNIFNVQTLIFWSLGLVSVNFLQV